MKGETLDAVIAFEKIIYLNIAHSGVSVPQEDTSSVITAPT